MSIARLTGTIKHYDWGGTEFIPHLLQQKNQEGHPFAEYWMGTHPLGVSVIETGEGQLEKLDKLVGDMPYLFKAQEVKEMLSIQVHPSKEAAELEFKREEEAGIPLDSPKRNYKDKNHKPEMLVALGDFYLLHGFKPPDQLAGILTTVPELRSLLPLFERSGYKGLYEKVMTMPQSEVNAMLQSLVDRVVPLYKEGSLQKKQEDFWAARAELTFSKQGNIDRGIFSIYLFNIVHLQKGECIFQDAGLPHAYLEGKDMELMANSDNVLRGGLTPKHIDVGELLKHVRCEATYPVIIKGETIADNVLLYKTPVRDFELTVLELPQDAIVTGKATHAEILCLTEGAVKADGVDLRIGNPSAVILPGTSYSIKGIAPASLVFRARVPA